MTAVAYAMFEERYAISNGMRDCLTQDVCAFMEDVDRFLTEKGGLAIAVEGVTGASKGNLQSLLKVISNATFGWHKPYERLSRYEFTHTREASGTVISTMSPRTVVRGLNALAQANLIGRFGTASNGTAVHYALNLPVIFERIRATFERMGQAGFAKCAVAYNMWERLSSSPILPRLGRYICHFFLERAQYGMKKVRELVNSSRELMANLASVPSLPYVSKSEREKRVTEAAAQPFFTPDKKHPDDFDLAKPNPKAVFAFWQKEVVDSELYPTFKNNRTIRSNANMKHWLKECRENGQTEEEIRESIRQYVRRWHYVEDNNRTIYTPTSRGKLCARRMPAYPDFQFFFDNRGVLVGTLMAAAEPNKSTDGTDLQDWPDFM